MARWRAEALKRLPELRKTIDEAPNIMKLWIELRMAFEEAYACKHANEDLIARIYSYADWCGYATRSDDAGKDPLTAVAVAFIEHIPECEAARADMPRWFCYQDIVIMRGLFSYALGDEAYEALLAYMDKHRTAYHPRNKPDMGNQEMEKASTFPRRWHALLGDSSGKPPSEVVSARAAHRSPRTLRRGRGG